MLCLINFSCRTPRPHTLTPRAAQAPFTLRLALFGSALGASSPKDLPQVPAGGSTLIAAGSTPAPLQQFFAVEHMPVDVGPFAQMEPTASIELVLAQPRHSDPQAVPLSHLGLLVNRANVRYGDELQAAVLAHGTPPLPHAGEVAYCAAAVCAQAEREAHLDSCSGSRRSSSGPAAVHRASGCVSRMVASLSTASRAVRGGTSSEVAPAGAGGSSLTVYREDDGADSSHDDTDDSDGYKDGGEEDEEDDDDSEIDSGDDAVRRSGEQCIGNDSDGGEGIGRRRTRAVERQRSDKRDVPAARSRRGRTQRGADASALVSYSAE